jgi:hypothetical protein
MERKSIKINETTLRRIVSESIQEVIKEGYFGDDATSQQTVDAAQEITDTYNDSNFRKDTHRPISNMTTLDFIRQNGGLQRVGQMPLDQLMMMIKDYIN